MCEFISWIENGDEILFLTADDVEGSMEDRRLKEEAPRKELGRLEKEEPNVRL